MKRFIIFTFRNQDLMGSDSYIPVDKRLSTRRLALLAQEIASRNKAVAKIDGFRVINCEGLARKEYLIFSGKISQ